MGSVFETGVQSVRIPQVLKQEGELLGAGDCCQDPCRSGGDAEDDKEASESSSSFIEGLKSVSSMADAMYISSVITPPDVMNCDCLRVASIRCRTMVFLVSVVAKRRKMASISPQLSGGIVSSTGIMRRPFSPPNHSINAPLAHWDRFVLGAFPNLLTNKRERRRNATFDLQFSDSVFAMAVDCARLDTEFSGDLLRA